MSWTVRRRPRRAALAAACAAVAAIAVAGAARAEAATIAVSSNAGLQAAVASGSAGDVVQLGGVTGGGSVYFPSSPLVVTRNLTIEAAPGAPVGLSINGTQVVDATGGFNDLIRVSPGVTLIVRGVTLTGTDSFSSAVDVAGSLSLDSVTLSGANLNAVTVEGGGTLNSLNSTIANNTGFGVVVTAGGTAALRSTTVAGNGSGGIFNAGGSSVSLVNTIVESAVGKDCDALVQSVTNSRGSDSPTTCGAGIAVGTSSLAAQTTNNGGLTNTRRLLAGSLALDAGTVAANCPAVDQRGAPRSVAPCDIGAYERDRTAPALAQPPNVPQAGQIPATGATTPVTYTLPTATDADGFLAIVNPVACNPASGSQFPSGVITTVSCTATNVDGFTDTKTFTVNVGPQPTIPPVVTVPANQTLEAFNASGTVFSFAVSATNGGSTPACAVQNPAGSLDPSNPNGTAVPTSGFTFPIRATTVVCSSTNTFGTGNASFVVSVQDKTGPVITPPPAQTVEATGPLGAVVNYTVPAAVDAVNGARPVACTPVSGSQFTLGTTTITCTASDLAAPANLGTATFTMTVRDTTPPILTVPGDLSLTATGPGGALGAFQVSALDAVAPASPVVTCAPGSGATFPIGVTAVTCTATDAAGNKATKTFSVQVAPVPTTATPSTPPPPPVVNSTSAPSAAAKAKALAAKKAKALAAKVKSSKLKAGPKATLLKMLAKPSCASLSAFLAKVKSVQKTKGAGLSAGSAASWTSAARSMRRTLGC